MYDIELFSDSYKLEIISGLKSMRREKEKRLKEIEDRIKPLRGVVGFYLAQKELYSTLVLTGNKEYETLIEKTSRRLTESQSELLKQEEQTKKECIALSKEISQIDELIKNYAKE